MPPEDKETEKYMLTVRIPYYRKDGSFSHTELKERVSDRNHLTKRQEVDYGWTLEDCRPAVEGEDYVDVMIEDNSGE